MKEDYFTNTVEDARDYARYHAEVETPDCDYDEPEEFDWEDKCRCSDPGCPCSVRKSGRFY